MYVCILTVEVTAQKFKPQSGLDDIFGWMNANIATDDWGREDVLIHFGAIQVSIKFLVKNKYNYINCTHFKLPCVVIYTYKS